MTKPDYKKIGSRIREARIEKGLTQAELGAKTGCSNNHMSHIETGQTKVSLTMLLEISSQLDKDLNYFLMEALLLLLLKMEYKYYNLHHRNYYQR